MKSSWLIQRLQAPQRSDNPFAFGGGMKNGGLSDQAMDIIRGIFSFDYMGSAEFEFGALPKTLQKIASSIDEYSMATIQVAFKYKEWKTNTTLTGKVPVYVICRMADLAEVTRRIEAYAKGKTPKSEEGYDMGTKERVSLDGSLAEAEYDKRTIGWLELDNGYFFFKDIHAFRKTAELFGLTPARVTK